MSDNPDLLPTIILGAVGTIGVMICMSSERKYKKAKKLHNISQTQDIMSVDTVISTTKFSDKKKKLAYVSGNIKSIDKSEVVYTESRPRYYSLFQGGLAEDQSNRNVISSKFLLTDGEKSIPVLPYQETLSFGLRNKAQEYSGIAGFLGMAFLFATTGLRIPLHLFDVNYSAYNGEFITAFGTLTFNLKSGNVEMSKAKYLLKGTKNDLVKHLSREANSRWWVSLAWELATGAILGFFLYEGYKTIQNWTRSRRVSRENPSVQVVNDLRCVICLKEYRTVTYKDCGHLAVCDTCDTQKKLTHCPICGKEIHEKTKFYNS